VSPFQSPVQKLPQNPAVVMFRTNNATHARIKQAAQQCGVSMNEWLKSVLICELNRRELGSSDFPPYVSRNTPSDS
jgi:hypothetical protein